ncbi:hypothetical protein [Rhodopirellula halodulae]|uniref:hypothetical protein n=1 Tax=Rhodopirellula halodulae TaxID=2894198 RepID=UPI001E4B9D3F|nr:hypothetical protein [Rhodopirellula sp. JC737]MCC9657816.1 hypothetical protein [Rhodopirellula sp. JC737]
MTPSQKLARARHCFQAWLKQENDTEIRETIQIRPETDAAPWSESVFICDGFYRGRRFRTENASAIWFTEEDELKIQNAEGSVVATLSSSDMEAQFQTSHSDSQTGTQTESPTPLRRAA